MYNRLAFKSVGTSYPIKLDSDHRKMLVELMQHYQMAGAPVMRLLIREAHKKTIRARPVVTTENES